MCSAGLNQLRALGHVTVMLDYSLDNLILLEIQCTRTLVVLDLVLKNRVPLAYKDMNNDIYNN